MASLSEPSADTTSPDTRNHWRERFSAWWHGQELAGPAEDAGAEDAGAEDVGAEDAGAEDAGAGDAGAEDAGAEEGGAEGDAEPIEEIEQVDGAAIPDEPAREIKTQPSAHLLLMQKIWGEGFTSPGGAFHVLDLVKPLGLNGSRDLLFFGAGLGGSARLLAETCDVRVEGWELDPSVVAASGGGVRAYNPEEQKTGDKTFDYVFSKEAFFTIADKDELFDTFAARLSERGQIVFTDYVIAEDATEAPEIRTWLKAEPRPRHPVTSDGYQSLLEARGLSLRSSEQITETHRQLILRGWEYFMEAMKQERLDRAILAALPGELEVWTRRVQAIEAGVLEVCWVHAGR